MSRIHRRTVFQIVVPALVAGFEHEYEDEYEYELRKEPFP